MSRPNREGEARRARFPRVSGDEPGRGADLIANERFSPRERG